MRFPRVYSSLSLASRVSGGARCERLSVSPYQMILRILFLSLSLSALGLAPALARADGALRYTFNSAGTLFEAANPAESTSPYWWVNSGGKLVIKDGVGMTAAGDQKAGDPWRLLYAATNALDTDGGLHPQNIFRLVTKGVWADADTSVEFKITKAHRSDSPNRDAHNGILFFSRYQDGDNLYYAGVRADGQAVIKKKIGGTYHTLASVQIFGRDGVYDRDDEPMLLPLKKWTGMKLETLNRKDGSVFLRLFLDRENDGTYVSILSAVDAGTGGSPFRAAGHSGIRTDFLDVSFDDFRVEPR